MKDRISLISPEEKTVTTIKIAFIYNKRRVQKNPIVSLPAYNLLTLLAWIVEKILQLNGMI